MRYTAEKITSGPIVQGHEYHAKDFGLYPGMAVEALEQESNWI